MDTSIPALFKSCLNAFKTICSRIERETTSDTGVAQVIRWQDELGRLRLWAANIGAHRTGQSSLDFRLKDSSHIRQQVTTLLLDLGQIFQEVEEVLDSLSSGQSSLMERDNTSDDDYDTGEELTQLHRNIVTVVNCLFQMSMLVRKPARHDFYTLPQSKEVLAFKPFDQAHVNEKYPEADERLLARLGLAITLRRQYLRYRERHHAKLKQGLEIGTEGSVAPTVTLSDTVVTGVEPWRIDSQDETTVSEISQTSYASSLVAGGPLVIPAPPKESSGGAPFECPYCFVVISVDGTSAWHKHVFQDLQPYICTVTDCSTPHTLFSTRHEWVQHMKELHPREWTGDEDGELNTSSFCAICPLCKSTSKSEKRFVRHLARHLQELALFVLPQDDEDSNTSDLLGKIDAESSVSSTESPIQDRLVFTGGGLRRRRDSQPESADDSRRILLSEPSGATRQSDSRFNEYFLDGARIHHQVLQSKIVKYFGPEAIWRPRVFNGRRGYIITAHRPFTEAQIDDLQALSRLYENELRERRHRRYPAIPYEESETYRSQDANLSYSDDTDMKNNDSYAPVPTPSGSTGGPGRIQLLPPILRGSSRANFDVGSPYASPSILEAPYHIGADFAYARDSARKDSRMDPWHKDPYSTGTGYDYADEEDPRMPPRQVYPRMDLIWKGQDTMDSVLSGSSATVTDAEYGSAYPSRSPLYGGSSAKTIDPSLQRKPKAQEDDLISGDRSR